MDLFDQYLRLFFLPDHKIIPLHRTWIWFSIGPMIRSLFDSCRPVNKSDYRNVLLKYYRTKKNRDYELYLIGAAKYIPVEDCDQEVTVLFDYLREILSSPDNTLRLCAWDTTYILLSKLNPDCIFYQKIKNMMTEKQVYSSVAPENFIKRKVAELLKLDQPILDIYYNYFYKDYYKTSDIFLGNLKTTVDWVTKKIQVEILLEYALENPKTETLHTAMHFCNLLKSSVVETVRNKAGQALVRIVPALSLEQRNDVVVELLQALEIRGYQFSEIPFFLGCLIISLQPVELEEIIENFIQQVKQPNPKQIYLLLRTVGFAIERYPKYRETFPGDEITFLQRLEKMLGILLNGLGNYDFQIKQVAFSVIGKEIFGSSYLTLEQKYLMFKMIAKKTLTLLVNDPTNNLMFLTNAAGLNHIYRFISDYVFFHGEMELQIPDKVAFFPGAFDPYSLSHKEITKTIRNMGFEVYLQTDEFSWSKHTLPNKLRRNIVQMSVADKLNIYLYPEDTPINIVNPADLEILRKSFSHSEVYMVAGSDVILNASAYQGPEDDNSIYHFSHIIFQRKKELIPGESDQGLDEAIKKIKGVIIKLALPPQYEDMSSSQIRNYIDENRDISSMVDPLAQQYIYENGFYRREPQYKTLIATISVKVEIIEEYSEGIEQELSVLFPDKNDRRALKKLRELMRKFFAKVIIMRDVNRQGRVLGFSVFHNVKTDNFFYEFKNTKISNYIRENAVGRIVIIDGIVVERKSDFDQLGQTILNETLTYCLGEEYHYAVFKNVIDDNNSLNEMLQLHGFQRLSDGDEVHPVFMVNMNTPCTLMLNVESIMKEPLRSNPHVKAAISRSRKKLQKAVTMLYPGNLVLTFDMKMIHEVLIRKICEENGVPTVPTIPKKLGKAMCVPFGNILNRYTVPNTVTKSLHTEKYYLPDTKSFNIQSFPYYLNLEDQIKMLKSFNRPVMLVDDLLHKGYRIRVIDPLLKQAKINVEKIFVGLLSGRGKELMDIQNRKVEGAYFIPKLKVWFNEDILYPFIGGDTLWRGVYPKRNLLPSINLILPYASPYFMHDAPNSAIYHLSEVCIENAIDILTTLEHEYLTIHGRTLTLALLGEVFIAPRCPDQGREMNYDLKYSPAYYLENDLELLRRIELFVDQNTSTVFPTQYE